jgi:hypothetical protein
VRLGTGDLASQSVLPPSWHWSGVQYRWKEGLSMDDVDFAPLPEVLLRAIINDVDISQRTSSTVSARAVLHGDIAEGGRHPHLLSYVTSKVFNHARYLSGSAQADMLMEIELVNERRCKPPKTPEQIRTLFYSCVEYRRKMEASGSKLPESDEDIAAVADKIVAVEEESKAPVSGYALHGLKWAAVEGWAPGEWLPGDWYIRMIHSDPPEVVLCVPQWTNTPCKGQIAFSFQEFRSAKIVAGRVFEATRRVILDGDSAEWQTIWRGQEGNSKRPRIVGLFEKLVIKKEKAQDVHVGTSSLRYATLAGYLLETLARAKEAPEDKPEPERSGRPRWVKPDELWLGWVKTWEEIGRSHDVAAGERVRMKRHICERMNVPDYREGRHLFGATKRSYVIFSPEWIAAIESLAEGAGEVAQEPSEDWTPNTGEPPIRKVVSARDFPRIPRIETQVLS